MIPMDIKGVPWVGDVYQRFEALCVDVDETIYEDTVKYVGDQMRNVGETVKKFYSDVMQDLLASSSVDSAKEKDALVTVPDNGGAAIYKKENLDNESESVDVASAQMEKLSDGAAIAKKSAGQQQYTPENPQSQYADLVSNQIASVENHVSNWQDQDPQLKSLSDSSSKDYNNIKNINPRRRVRLQKFSVEKWPYPENLYDRDIHSCRCKERISNEVSSVEVSQSNENVLEFSVERIERSISPVEGSQMQGASFGGVSTKLDDSVVSMEAGLGTTTTNNNLDAVIVGNKRVSDAGDDKQGSLKLEESCILVERDDHFSESTVEDVQKSYKKKIREAFSTRRWSRSKRSSEQLAPRSEERRGKSLVSSSMVHTEIQNSQTSDSFESEWELL